MWGNEGQGEVKGPAELGTRSRWSRDHITAKLMTKIHNQCNIYSLLVHSSTGQMVLGTNV